MVNVIRDFLDKYKVIEESNERFEYFEGLFYFFSHDLGAQCKELFKQEMAAKQNLKEFEFVTR